MSANQPAFPHQPAENANGERILYGGEGMTMRQFYKAAALTAIAGNSDLLMSIGHMSKHSEKYKGMEPSKIIAASCGEYADALLAEDEEHAKK